MSIYYPGCGGIFTGKDLQVLNGQNKLEIWARWISECRSSGQSVEAWCRENGGCEQIYYKWQRKLFEMVMEQQKVQFVEVTPVQHVCSSGIAVTIRIARVEAEIHNGAEATTMEAVLRVFKSC